MFFFSIAVQEYEVVAKFLSALIKMHIYGFN